MPDNPFWRAEVDRIYEEIAKHTEPYTITIGDMELLVRPGVFSPAYFTDSAFFAIEVPKIVGQKSLLEIGTGTAIVAIAAAKNGARVVATDISSEAIVNANHNIQRHGLDIPVLYGDVFDAIRKNARFDFIFWNHPFNKGDNPDETMLRRSGFDYQYQGLEKYFAEAYNHLTPEGRLLLGTGTVGGEGGADLDAIHEIAQRNGYTPELLKSEIHPVTPGSPVLNKYLIYDMVR